MSKKHNYVISPVEKAQDLTYALAIRAIVFIEEQSCPFSEEYDLYDTLEAENVTHFLVKENEIPLATARIIYGAGNKAKIGRIAVLKEHRGKGIATALLKRVISTLLTEGKTAIGIHAQAHLERYYQTFGFSKEGEIFEEASIPHIKMTFSPN